MNFVKADSNVPLERHLQKADASLYSRNIAGTASPRQTSIQGRCSTQLKKVYVHKTLRLITRCIFEAKINYLIDQSDVAVESLSGM